MIIRTKSITLQQVCRVFGLHYAHYYCIICSCKVTDNTSNEAVFTCAGASILCQTVLGQNRLVRRGCPVMVSGSFYRGEFLENLDAHQTDSCGQRNHQWRSCACCLELRIRWVCLDLYCRGAAFYSDVVIGHALAQTACVYAVCRKTFRPLKLNLAGKPTLWFRLCSFQRNFEIGCWEDSFITPSFIYLSRLLHSEVLGVAQVTACQRCSTSYFSANIWSENANMHSICPCSYVSRAMFQDFLLFYQVTGPHLWGTASQNAWNPEFGTLCRRYGYRKRLCLFSLNLSKKILYGNSAES